MEQTPKPPVMNEELKNSIWQSWKFDQKTNPNAVNPYAFEYGAKVALSSPSILKHADPEIMKQAGWIRQEDYQKAIDGLKKCMDNPDFPRSFAQATLIDLKEL